MFAPERRDHRVVMMAYSPSPQPGATGPNGNFSTLNRRSVSPILAPISKRDKRRNAWSERLKDISANFAQNRDANYRAQLQGLQLAVNFVGTSDPYRDRQLNDDPEEIFEELSAAAADAAHRVAQPGSRSVVTDVPLGTERWAAAYVQEINNEMETRDVNLTIVAVSFVHPRTAIKGAC